MSDHQEMMKKKFHSDNFQLVELKNWNLMGWWYYEKDNGSYAIVACLYGSDCRCNTSSESNEEQPLKVYSFSGEDEYISVSNGVIILDGKDEICYGGDLKVMSDDFANITTYSTTIYINGSEKETLLSNGVDDQTGETIDVSGNVGQISGDILRDSDADKLTDNLWFELKTTNLNGEESTYRVQLETTEITKEVKK